MGIVKKQHYINEPVFRILCGQFRDYLLLWSAKAFSVCLEVIIFLRRCLNKGLKLLRQAGGQRSSFGLRPLR